MPTHWTRRATRSGAVVDPDRRRRDDSPLRRAGTELAPLLAAIVIVLALLWASSSGLSAAVASAHSLATTEGESGASNPRSPVQIDDDAGGRSLFDETPLLPGQVRDNCLVVTYHGTHLPVDVFLDATVAGSGLEHHLTITVETGTGGQFDDCSDFAATGEVFTGTLAELGDETSDRPMRVWSPKATGESLSFRFVLDYAGHPEARGTGAAYSFTWKARSA